MMINSVPSGQADLAALVCNLLRLGNQPLFVCYKKGLSSISLTVLNYLLCQIQKNRRTKYVSIWMMAGRHTQHLKCQEPFWPHHPRPFIAQKSNPSLESSLPPFSVSFISSGPTMRNPPLVESFNSPCSTSLIEPSSFCILPTILMALRSSSFMFVSTVITPSEYNSFVSARQP